MTPFELALLKKYNFKEARQLKDEGIARAYWGASSKVKSMSYGLGRRSARMFDYYCTDMIYVLGPLWLEALKEKRWITGVMLKIGNDTGGKHTNRKCKSIRVQHHAGDCGVWKSGLYRPTDPLRVPEGIRGDKLYEIYGRMLACL